MRIINASGTDTIVLGYPGEHERTKVRFYYGDIKSEFPEGTLMLQVRRPGENTKYEVELEPDGYYAYWLVSDYDLVNEGLGECQLIYATTTAVSKKKVWKTQVEKGIKGKNIGIPPTWESIETRLLTAATTLQATIDETEERLDAAEERMDLVEQDVAAAQQAATDAANSATEAVNTAQQAIVDIQDATASGVDTVNAEVIKAEGWAEGTQNGQPSDEYADKSAKHWAEQASSSATDSASSASSAAASQASAASSESNAETYMRGAEQHKIGAETAAAEAESSATDAETAMAAAQAAQAAAEASRDSAAEFYDEVAASVSEAQRAEQGAEVAANDAEANALIAEGWAQGTQNGVPVADGEYYQNNAEYWAGIATDNAARTDTLAAEALRSMQAAGVSETNAASYAAAANTSANNANASAAQAYQSEQNAALSQVNAQNSQSAARVSAEKAARSESAAAGSASVAEAAVNRYNNMSAVATTLEAEAEATASIDHSGSAPVLRLGIPQGQKGNTGDSGVYVGTTEPTDPDVKVWINPEGSDDFTEDINALKTTVSELSRTRKRKIFDYTYNDGQYRINVTSIDYENGILTLEPNDAPFTNDYNTTVKVWVRPKMSAITGWYECGYIPPELYYETWTPKGVLVGENQIKIYKDANTSIDSITQTSNVDLTKFELFVMPKSDYASRATEEMRFERDKSYKIMLSMPHGLSHDNGGITLKTNPQIRWPSHNISVYGTNGSSGRLQSVIYSGIGNNGCGIIQNGNFDSSLPKIMTVNIRYAAESLWYVEGNVSGAIIIDPTKESSNIVFLTRHFSAPIPSENLSFTFNPSGNNNVVFDGTHYEVWEEEC